ncbi:outer membrane protein assembly factor [Elizabethkingia occulta]|uniref:Outer membrane protein assembly factor BamA n=1 Tax=Elizabethkingia occulta TaxID=1867263 RepID=A0A1T3MFQ2_9FLAO|nr:POTRA domain-containing protein [Elizabethkingia occulta]OPB91347.1 outer membrane protein assembly factor BamA [Elizabethkingia occulta]OPC63101.1 outer membrane protein assembly factor BamA [Elizabethkingia occulta]
MKFRSLPIFLFIASAHFYGQVTPPQTTQNSEAVAQHEGTYVLKDIVVDGVKKYTPEQILRFTGLVKGESVEIPGQRLSTAIKKLWDSQYFSEVEVYVQSIEGQNIVLKFSLQDLKELGEVKFTGKGIKKSKNEKLIKDNNLKPGMKITENLVTNLKHNVPQQYITKGFPDAKITIEDKINAKDPSLIDWTINVDKGKRVKIDRIDFEGNNSVSSSKLRKNGFKNTKQKRFLLGLLKPSKFIKDKYEEDKKTLVDYYNSLGFRDMRVVSDSVTRNDKGYNIKVKVDEGKKYYIGDITFVGNTVFSTEALTKLLGYKKGDIYDSVGFKKKVGEEGGKEDNSDIASSYMDSGYLFSNVNAVEKSIKNDTISMEVRIHEGTKATWNRVTWGGNVTTHDHVILRSLRTRPGDLFSKANIKRTYFDLAGMSYFDPQQIGQDIKPNAVDNTADIHWTVVEKGSSQVQVQAGYGGNSFIGTLGLTFNNFSLKNFLRLKDFRPVPQGDGQILSLQAQAGQYFQNYSISFTEPWLFGTKPTALSVGFNYSRVKYTDQYGAAQKLNIFSANAGLNRLLRWPDDYFSLYTGLSYQRYEFNNYPFQFGTETLYNGEANNFAVNIGISRNAAGPDPFFKTSGSDFEISAKLTPPYSLFSKKDYNNMSAINKYRWLEFYKIKLKADSYNQIIGKLVLRSSIEMGFLDGYNKQLGAPPFERFYMGGVGLFNGRFDGRELIPLRGYEDASSTGGTNQDITPYGGGTIYNRINFELRYPISMSQTAKIYALTFLEGGNTWQGWGSYNPFQLKRSAGIGIRVYMGAFGLIGFDFAYGFDKTIGGTQPNGWKTHFLMNQQL